MRALLISLVLALVAVLAMAEVKAPACSTPQQGASLAPITVADWARIQGLQAVEPAPRSTDFECPAIFNCGFNCSPVGGTTVDTGERSCKVDDNTIFLCAGGKTIHVTSGSCRQKPCCTQFPACLCGPCAGFQTWTCA